MSAALKIEQPPMPAGVRLAGPDDEAALWDICMAAFADNGFGVLDPASVRATIAKGVRHQGGVVFAVIGDGARIDAVLGLVWTKLWYCADWHWQDLLLFVRPEARESRHAVTLLRFARWWATTTGMHVILGVMSQDDQDRKEKLLSRYARRTSSSFVIDPNEDGDGGT